jgi:hypothetical protein
MAQGKSGMGMHKHGISGTVGPNRRRLQLRAMEANRLAAEKKEPKAPTYNSIAECLKNERRP